MVFFMLGMLLGLLLGIWLQSLAILAAWALNKEKSFDFWRIFLFSISQTGSASQAPRRWRIGGRRQSR